MSENDYNEFKAGQINFCIEVLNELKNKYDVRGDRGKEIEEHTRELYGRYWRVLRDSIWKLERFRDILEKGDRKMDLKETIEMMTSDDYKERFKAEYYQTKERYERLKRFNDKIEAAMETAGEPCKQVDAPKHDSPYHLLRMQQGRMGEYLHILELRAIIEGVDLNLDDITNKGGNGSD